VTVNLICNKPFASVVIPTYNRTHPTIAAIESVLAQTYRNFEIIVVDDGSTDDSSGVVEQFVREKSNGIEIQYVSQANQGSSVARNTGIEKARGDYIAFLDSDDAWFPEKLERQVGALEQLKDECGACFTDSRCMNSRGMDIDSFHQFGIKYAHPVGIDRGAAESIARAFCGFWISTLVARTDMIRRIGGFNPKISFCEDRDLYFRLSLDSPLAYVNAPLARIDRNATPPGSGCRPWDKVEIRLRGQQRMYEGWLTLGGALPPDVRKTVLEDLRAVHCDWANVHLENDRYDKARSEVSKAASYGLTPKMATKFALTWIAPAIAKKLSGKPAQYL
jgi:glycosyltransferase involved in cell wall biosynthesis